MSRMGIPSTQQFRNATSIKETSFLKKVKKKLDGRGSNMMIIDAALEEWEAVYPGIDTAAKLKALSHVVAACSWWLKLKGEKESSLSAQRRIQVEAIRRLALKAMTTLDTGHGAMAAKKSTSILAGQVTGNADKHGHTVGGFQGTGTKSLAQGYHLEREVFLKANKQFAVAAGSIRDVWEEGGGEWEHITLQDYAGIYNAIADKNKPGSQVAYLRKAERVAYLAIPQGQCFLRSDGTALQSTGMTFERKGDVWAMDRYGNMFVKDPGRIPGKGSYFNHSSFTAGTEVVCAGVVMFNAGGVLVYLDNASGHYQPDRYALHAALSRLQGEGIPLNNVRVGVFHPTHGISDYKALSFLANPDGVADWDPAQNAALNLPGVVSV